MNKRIRILISLVLMLALAASITTAVFADDSEVSYSGSTKTFTFDTGENLFRNFDDVMPGDTVSQKLAITVTPPANASQTRIYLRAEEVKSNLPEGETAVSMADFLSQLSMTVKQGDKILYEGSPDQVEGLRNNVLLGTFTDTGKQTATLTIELNVPKTLGNEYAERTGLVRWILTAEVIEDEGGGTTPVVPVRPITPPVTPRPRPTQVPTPAPTPEVIQPITPEETVPDDTVPKAEFTIEEPAQGKAWALVNLLCTVLSVADCGWMLGSFFKNRKDDETEQIKDHNSVKPFTAIPAVGSIAAFLLTENMKNPMVLVDKWTILMVGLLAANAGLTWFGKKKQNGETAA